MLPCARGLPRARPETGLSPWHQGVATDSPRCHWPGGRYLRIPPKRRAIARFARCHSQMLGSPSLGGSARLVEERADSRDETGGTTRLSTLAIPTLSRSRRYIAVRRGASMAFSSTLTRAREHAIAARTPLSCACACPSPCRAAPPSRYRVEVLQAAQAEGGIGAAGLPGSIAYFGADIGCIVGWAWPGWCVAQRSAQSLGAKPYCLAPLHGWPFLDWPASGTPANAHKRPPAPAHRPPTTHHPALGCRPVSAPQSWDAFTMHPPRPPGLPWPLPLPLMSLLNSIARGGRRRLSPPSPRPIPTLTCFGQVLGTSFAPIAKWR